MKRIDAEHRSSPLHPRKLTTGLEAPALPLGQKSERHPIRRRVSRDIREPVDDFYTNYDAVLSTVRGKLAKRRHFVPEDRLPKRVGPDEHITVIIASGNGIKSKRIEELTQQHVKQSDIIHVADAEEIHRKVVALDAMSKAKDAAKKIRKRRRDLRTRPQVIVAVDQLNAIPFLRKEKATTLTGVKFKRMGQPGSEPGNPYQTIQEMFQYMADLARKQNWPTIPYLIEMATVIHNPHVRKGKDTAISIQKSAVFLDPEKLAYLATPEGFAEYQRLTEARKVDIKKTAGGFEYMTLKEMGAVVFTTGLEGELMNPTFPEQRTAAEVHAYQLALGQVDEWLFEAYFTGKIDRALRTRRG